MLDEARAPVLDQCHHQCDGERAHITVEPVPRRRLGSRVTSSNRPLSVTHGPPLVRILVPFLSHQLLLIGSVPTLCAG